MTTINTEDQDEEFVEGEPDLHAPEEEALEVPREKALLEQELDNEEILEEDLEEGLVEETLEDLDAKQAEALGIEPATVAGEEPEEELSEEEIEAGLDEILQQRLGVEEAEEEGEAAPPAGVSKAEDVDFAEVLPPQPGEFVCRGCFLLKRRELLADPARGLCRDCTA